MLDWYRLRSQVTLDPDQTPSVNRCLEFRPISNPKGQTPRAGVVSPAKIPLRIFRGLPPFSVVFAGRGPFSWKCQPLACCMNFALLLGFWIR